jgi:hypothetical protein
MTYWLGVAEKERLQVYLSESGKPEDLEAHRHLFAAALGDKLSFDMKRLVWNHRLFDMTTGDFVYSVPPQKTWNYNLEARALERESHFSPSGTHLVFGNTVYSMGRKSE